MGIVQLFTRLAAEEQIRDLQGLIDETFKQFALDDSEDDFEDDSEGSVIYISC